MQGFGDSDDDGTFGFGQDEEHDYNDDFEDAADSTHRMPLKSFQRVQDALDTTLPRAGSSIRLSIRPRSAATQATGGYLHVSHAEK